MLPLRVRHLFSRAAAFLMKRAAEELCGNVPFTEYTEHLQEGHVLSVYRVWAEVILYQTQNFWLFMTYTEAGYLLTVPYVEYFQ